MSQMLKSSGALGAATLTSRVLGLLREIAYARFMGDGWVAGAFILAFMIPNLFRRLLGEGALTAAFIPIFKEKEKLEGDVEMWRAANAVISGLLVAAVVIIVIGVAVVSGILKFGHFDGQNLLMLQLLRVMFPYVLLVCLAAILMGMLNARGHFFVPAIGAGMLNVVMIASVFLIAPLMRHGLENQIFGLAIGVLVAGCVQAGFQVPVLRREGFRYRWTAPWKDETVRRVVRQMLPATIGVAAYQMNVMFTQGIAFWVDPTVVASFNYAVRMMELPQGVFGLSLATYLLPTLSGLSAEKKYDEFRTTLGDGLGYLVFINLLASILLMLLAEPMIRLLFERGRFDAYSTSRAALALLYLAPGLLAFSMVNILARAFFALGDTKTPMKVSIFCFGLNAVLTFALIFPLRQGGLGLANTLTSVINVGLLGYALRKKIGGLELRRLWQQVPGMAGAAFVAATMAWLISWQWQNRVAHTNLWLKIGAVAVPSLVAAFLYFGICWQLKVPYMSDIVRMVPARLRIRPKEKSL